MAEECQTAFTSYTFKKGDSIYGIAEEAYGEIVTLHGKEVYSWKILLAQNYQYVHRCFDINTCQTIDLNFLGIEEFLSGTPKRRNKRKIGIMCNDVKKANLDHKYFCEFEPGDVIQINTAGISSDDETPSQLTLPKGESLFETIQTKYRYANLSDEQLTIYTMVLSAQNGIDSPFAKSIDTSCLQNYHPFNYFFAETEAAEGQINLADLQSVQKGGIFLSIEGSP